MTAEEARAVRHSGCKCVPRHATPEMLAVHGTAMLWQQDWTMMYDAAPACECEALRLLRELVGAWEMPPVSPARDYDEFMKPMNAARAYLARSKP